jgi:hypothetical protein
VRPLTTICFALVLVAAVPARAAGDGRAAAHEHFDRGMAASNDQRFAEAVREFEQAYELWPDYRVLYNIGKVRVTLGRSAEAVAAFEAYLEKGGAELPEERRQEVREAVAGQLAHVATIDVRVSEDGAEVRVDGRLVGTSPLGAPVRVTEGKHTVEALRPGQPVQLREIDLPGASTLTVELAFPPPPRPDPPAPPPAAPPPAPSPPSAAPAPPPQASLVAHAAAPDPGRTWRAVGYGVAGVGLITAVVGASLAWTGATEANAARALLVEASMPLPPSTPDVLKYDLAKRDYDAARTRNQLGWALVGTGAAVLVCGGVLAFWPGGLSLRGRW